MSPNSGKHHAVAVHVANLHHQPNAAVCQGDVAKVIDLRKLPFLEDNHALDPPLE